MTELQWTRDQAGAYLSAMKAAALAAEDQRFDEIERGMLRATAEDVLHRDVDVESLSPIEPEELAQQILDPRQRGQAIEFLALMLYLDGTVDDSEVELIDRFALALEVRSPDS